MIPIGKLQTWRLLVLLLTVFWAGTLKADVTATLDRESVAMGDTLRLQIVATAGEPIDDIPLGELLTDFEILQRGTSSSTRVVNGKATSSRTINLDITPRREGDLRVPALTAGLIQTVPIAVTVGPAPTLAANGDLVLFEAELDREQVYVQGQLLLTLRLQQAVSLEARSITELQIDGAFVKPLQQRTFNRRVNGQTWQVYEVRYAVFPEQSGVLTIPSQTFNARIAQQRRSLFDVGGGGKPIRRSTLPLSIEVLPRPAGYPDQTWLPATALRVEESWSTPPESLKAGESATRTLRLVGEGLQGAQLPPLPLPEVSGLKFYPDQPDISERESDAGITGVRVDSAAIVPTNSGSWTLPEIRIPWWDTNSGSLQFATVPAREVSVSGPATAAAELAPTTAQPAPSQAVADATPFTAGYWPWVAAAALMGWMLTALAWLYSRRGSTASEPAAREEHPDEKNAFKALSAACASDQPLAARQALITWANCRSHTTTRLESVAAALAGSDDRTLWDDTVTELEAAAFSDTAHGWQGSQLLGLLKDARQRKPAVQKHDNTLQLYPG